MIHLQINIESRQISYQELRVITALLSTGALDGVKGGKTIIHFDDEGTFRGIQFDYWPYKERKTHNGTITS